VQLALKLFGSKIARINIFKGHPEAVNTAPSEKLKAESAETAPEKLRENTISFETLGNVASSKSPRCLLLVVKSFIRHYIAKKNCQ